MSQEDQFKIVVSIVLDMDIHGGSVAKQESANFNICSTSRQSEHGSTRANDTIHIGTPANHKKFGHIVLAANQSKHQRRHSTRVSAFQQEWKGMEQCSCSFHMALGRCKVEGCRSIVVTHCTIYPADEGTQK